MGNACQSELPIEERIYNPAQLDFKRVHSIAISPHYTQLLDRIKKVADFPDARDNPGLKWFHSVAFDLYMFGDLNNRKPTGNCLFFFKNLSPQEDLPVIILTSIEENNSYCPNTLLVYPDKSYYIGSIISSGVSSPKANGKGLLVNRSFIYEGQFKNGLPHGYGTFRSKSGKLVGEFKEGQPHGRCVERSNKGLFMGQLVSRFRKNGKLITPGNEVELVNEEYQQSGNVGHTLVEL